jgi:TPR repeat protein
MDPLKQALDLLLDNKATIETLAAVVALLAALLAGTLALLRWPLRRLVTARALDPLLRLPEQAGAIHRYTARALDLLGRDEALALLERFLDARTPFAWMQIAGVGGQGKSRLALELCRLAGRRWRTGFLSNQDLDAFHRATDSPEAAWERWRPKRRHLIVLDYVVGREEHIRPLLQTLARRAEQLPRGTRVRVLLLERQRWDRGGLPALEPEPTGARGSGSPALFDGGDGRAEWFLKLAEPHGGEDQAVMDTRFETGVLELERLGSDDLVSIVRQVVGRVRGDDTAQTPDAPPLPDDAALAEQLAHIDSAGRPLYAYFLGQALALGTRTTGWSRDDLLTETLARDSTSRWRRELGDQAPCLGDGQPAERLAVIATIAGGLDCAAAVRAGHLTKPDAEARRQALILADGPISTGPAGPPQVIPPLQPDLLGEWLVLSAIHHGLPAADVVDAAWRIAPDSTASFLQRLTQDFPEHAVTAEMLGREPPAEAAEAALEKVATDVGFWLSKAKQVFPQPVTQALIRAAESGDGKAMGSLGWWYLWGKGIPNNDRLGVQWLQRGADAGNAAAMRNLGSCYAKGQGVEKDTEKAVDWYRKSVDLGDPGAMRLLGLAYESGKGIGRDIAQAVHWYAKSANLGYAPAMVNLGLCLEFGDGIEQDAAKAVAWYQKAAMHGDGSAMGCLASCFQNGTGVEADLVQAAAWYRKGADAGNGLAMRYLGLCYQNGDGVEKDLAQAVDWYRKGAELGEGLAMASLGRSYALGEGVERDLSQAIRWYRQALDAGVETTETELISVEGVQRLLHGANDEDGAANAWAREQAERLGRSPWADLPPLPGDWREIVEDEGVPLLQHLWVALDAAGLKKAQADRACVRLRALSLPFYPDHELVDLQLERLDPAPDDEPTVLVSAVAGPKGALLLDYRSDTLHGLNAWLLELSTATKPLDYLCFFCAFISGDDGPFHLVERVEHMAADIELREDLQALIGSVLTPIRYLDGDMESDGSARFEAFTLYGRDLFLSTYKVLADGMVECENEEADPVARNLPIPQRRYNTIFRSPPRFDSAQR